jgi:hypothetical protein
VAYTLAFAASCLPAPFSPIDAPPPPPRIIDHVFRPACSCVSRLSCLSYFVASTCAAGIVQQYINTNVEQPSDSSQTTQPFSTIFFFNNQKRNTTPLTWLSLWSRRGGGLVDTTKA